MGAKEPADHAPADHARRAPGREETISPSETHAASAESAERTRLDTGGPDPSYEKPLLMDEKPLLMDEKPLLMVDIDGVISLFGFAGRTPWASRPGDSERLTAPEGSFHAIDGIPHFLSHASATHLLDLAADFDLVWASGWEEKAEEYLPRLLDLPAGLPFLHFERGVGGIRSSNAHWKLAAIEEYAGSRPLAWIDDAFNDACHAWADARPAPTLLVQTIPAHGLTSKEASLLQTWAREPKRLPGSP